jgi:hypothetical protein
MLSSGLPLWWIERRLLRRRAARVPLVTLAALLRDGTGTPLQQLTLCMDLGLRDRAREAARGCGALPPHLALPLAWLEGDLAAFDAIAADAALPAALARAPAGWQNRCLSLLSQRDARQALAIAVRMPRQPLCAPAIAWRAGDHDRALGWARHPLWSRHADYRLLQANLADGATAKLDRLNAYLARHGLAPLRLLDAGRPPGTSNLAARVTPPPAAVAPVSVIVPTHDNAGQVAAAIGSLLQQTLPPAEIIVVDDASTDATSGTVAAIAARSPTVRQIRLPVNRGAYVARNVGLAASRCTFVAFQDADDFAHPERLQRALQPMLDDPAVHATTSRCVRLRDDGTFGEARTWPLTRWTPISLVLRRDVALRVAGGFEEARFGADSEYAARLRLLLGETHHRLVPEPLALFAQRAGSLTTSGAAAFDAQGRSDARIVYQQAWMERHLAHLLDGTPLAQPIDPRTAALAEPDAAPG